MTSPQEPPARWDKDTPLTEGHKAGLSARVRQSGLLAEIRVAQAAASARWMTSLRPNYHDRDTAKTREYDVAIVSPSTRWEETEHGRVTTQLCAAVEVKTARKTPWVLVRPPEGTMREGSAPPPLANAPQLPFEVGPWLSKVLRGRDHPLASSSASDDCWTAASIIEPYQEGCTACGHKSRGPTASFKASYTAVKAAHDLVDRENRRAGQGLKRSPGGVVTQGSALTLGRPVVVLDGRLLGYWAKQDGSEVWSSLPAGLLDFELQTGRYPLTSTRIDVVTPEFLPDYMTFLGRVLDAVHDAHVIAYSREGPRRI